MARYILAIDSGTSSTKSIVLSEEGEAMAWATAGLNTTYGSDGTAEQEPEEIYRSAITAVTDAVNAFETEHGISRDTIACAGIANQRETFVLWDKNGAPLHNAVVWQCKRSVDVCGELKKAGAEEEVRSRSGLIIDPYFSGTKLTWLVRNNGGIAAAHTGGEAYFGTVDSWLLYRLTGGVHATDHTNASRTLLLNLHSLQWDSELAELFEVPALNLPEVRSSAGHYGESDFSGVFPNPVPITAMIGDSHSAFFGERCYRTGDAKATLGTGCSMLFNVGPDAPPAYPTTVGTVGFSTPNRIDYALEGIIVSAGSVLTWLQRELGLFDDPAELEAIALDLEDTGGAVMVPGHAGLGAPFWRMGASGSISGLTFGTGKHHIIRAALECIPYQIRAIVDAVCQETGMACNAIRVDGGISKNEFVVQWLADTLEVPVHTSAMSDVTARGAAFLAGIGADIYSGAEQIAALDLEESVHHPGAGTAAAARGYSQWRGVIDKAQ